MKIHSINNQWNNIAFRSGYPTFQSAGHLTFCGNKTPIHENTNPSDRQMTTNKGDNISFTGSPFNRDSHDSVSFKGMPPYRHHADEGKARRVRSEGHPDPHDRFRQGRGQGQDSIC